MPFDFQQYQVKTESPDGVFEPISRFESTYHQPWSEPVRVKIAPRLAVALIASGLFAPVLNPEIQIISQYESRWHEPWSEPVRFKPRLHASLNPFPSSFFDLSPNPGIMIQGWYQALREPVWPKKGFKSYLQQTLAHPPRLLPTSNVTAVISALEHNNDSGYIGVYVYTAPPVSIDQTAVKISISEITLGNSAQASIKESD